MENVGTERDRADVGRVRSGDGVGGRTSRTIPSRCERVRCRERGVVARRATAADGHRGDTKNRSGKWKIYIASIRGTKERDKPFPASDRSEARERASRPGDVRAGGLTELTTAPRTRQLDDSHRLERRVLPRRHDATCSCPVPAASCGDVE